MSHDKRTCHEASTCHVHFFYAARSSEYDGWDALLFAGICWRLRCASLLVHPVRLWGRCRLTRTLEFFASYQVRPGHRQHPSGASLRLCVARVMKEPA